MTSFAMYMELKISTLLSLISGKGTIKSEMCPKPSPLLQLESLMQEPVTIAWPPLFLASSQDSLLQSCHLNLELLFKVSLRLIQC